MIHFPTQFTGRISIGIACIVTVLFVPVTMILTLRMKRGVFIYDPPVVVLAENNKEGWLV